MKKKKEYQKPQVELLWMERADVVTASGGEVGVPWPDDWSGALGGI